MFDIHDPLVQLKITSATCSSVAIGTTVYRLYVRRLRFWYDDGFAFLSLLVLLIQVCAVFMHVPDPSEFSHLTRVAAYYLIAVTFYTMIWSARLSILYSVIRIDPSEGRRKRLFYISILFMLVWLILMAQLFWVCEPEPNWRNQATPQCKLNKQVAICQVVSDVISDTILIVAPLKLLAGLSDPGLRRRLIVIFSTCIITTVVSLVHAAYIIIGGGPKVLIAALVEDCMSLIVCNLPVVVAASIDLRERPEAKGSSFLSSYMRFTSLISAEKAAHSRAAAATARATTTFTLNTLGGQNTTVMHKSDSFVKSDDEVDSPGLHDDHKQLPTPATAHSVSFSVV